LALLNLENRRKNAESVRQAQLKERARAREMEARRAGAARGEAAEEGDRAAARRTVKAKVVVHRANGEDGTPDERSRSPSARDSPAKVVPADQELEKLKRLQREKETKGIPTIHKPLMDDDIIGALDLGIDVDIEI
jgi:RNA polymerase-associated protein RTF1